MERRRAMSSYAKLKEQAKEQQQQQQLDNNNSENEVENEDELPALRRSHSVRASLRRLKSKLHSPALALQSPFKLRAHLHSRSRSGSGIGSGSSRAATLQRSKVVKALRLWQDIDAVAVVTTKVKGEFVPLKKQTMQQNAKGDHELGIEQLMSSLPVGVSLPRKACKLLQIPESYCHSPKTAPKATLDSDLERTLEAESPSARDSVLADITRHAHQGIYGTTRMRTATIRKPMPYLNSRRCFQSNVMNSLSIQQSNDQVY